MKRSSKNIVVNFLGLLLIIISYWIFGKYGNNWMSMTFMIVLVGTIGINVIVWKQKWFFGKVDDLPIMTVQFYYSEMFSTLRAIFTGFIIAFSILWGLQYTLGSAESSKLQIQTFLLLVFLVYLVFAAFYTFIQDFKIRIGE